MKSFALSLLVFASFHSFSAGQNVIVVANAKSEVTVLSRAEVRNIFMGGVDDRQLRPVSLPPEAPARVIFNTKVIGLTESRIQSYWSRMRFSGRLSQPAEAQDVHTLISIVASDTSSIAFLPASTSLPDSVKVVYATSSTRGNNNSNL